MVLTYQSTSLQSLHLWLHDCHPKTPQDLLSPYRLAFVWLSYNMKWTFTWLAGHVGQSEFRLSSSNWITLGKLFTHVSVNKQYNLVPVSGLWCPAAGKVTLVLASHCLTDVCSPACVRWRGGGDKTCVTSGWLQSWVSGGDATVCRVTLTTCLLAPQALYRP